MTIIFSRLSNQMGSCHFDRLDFPRRTLIALMLATIVYHI